MKVYIYETDVFYNYIDLDGICGYSSSDDEEFMQDVPDELITEYVMALEKFKNISRRLGEIKAKGNK